jgi:integrase/recombinase XerD
MVTIKLKYLVQDLDRHGNVRCYVRLPGRRKVRIRGMSGSAEFMAAYHAALSEIDSEDKRKDYRIAAKGSFGSVCLAYYASEDFQRLDKSTQKWRRRSLDAICEKHGHRLVAEMQPKNVRKLRDEKASKPGAARNRVKALRALFRWAVEEGLAPLDPTSGVRFIPYLTTGHHTWSLEEVAAYEKRHPIGSKARLAMALMLYTACRREDAVRLGPRHVCHGRIQYVQAKNEHRKPVEMDIPIHPELQAIIESTPSHHLTFLVTEYGRPFTANGFGNKFKQWCREAGLPHCSSHGLRKAAATRLAEGGATPHEIMAITGHRSLEEVERYTRKALKAKLADSAMSKLKG